MSSEKSWDPVCVGCVWLRVMNGESWGHWRDGLEGEGRNKILKVQVMLESALRWWWCFPGRSPISSLSYRMSHNHILKYWSSERCCLLAHAIKRTCVCMNAQSFPSSPTLWDPMDCGPPGSSVQGVLQASILAGVATPSSRGVFLTQESNLHLLHCRRILYPLNHLRSPTKRKYQTPKQSFIQWKKPHRRWSACKDHQSNSQG